MTFIIVFILAIAIFPNSLFFTLALLSQVILILFILVNLSYLTSFIILLLSTVYIGAIIILIGYICAITPNLNLSSYSTSFFVIISSIFLFSSLINPVSQSNQNTSSLTLPVDYFYSSSGSFILLLFLSMLFLTLLLVTNQFTIPNGPFRSLS